MKRLLLAVGLAVIFAPQARADLIFIAANNSPTVTTHCDANNAACNLAFPDLTTIQLGVFNSNGILVTASTHEENLPLGIINSQSLSVVNLNHTPVSATVVVGGTNFVGPRNTFALSGSGTFQNVGTGASITDRWYDDPRNRQPATTAIGGIISALDTPGDLLATDTFHSTLNLNSFSFNTPVTPLADPDVGLFSMTLFFTFTLPGSPADCTATDTSSCAQLISRGQNLDKFSAIPEPASLGLLGAGLLGLGIVRRRKA